MTTTTMSEREKRERESDEREREREREREKERERKRKRERERNTPLHGGGGDSFPLHSLSNWCCQIAKEAIKQVRVDVGDEESLTQTLSRVKTRFI